MKTPFLLGIFAFLIRLLNAGAEHLWYDESFTAWIAKLPLDQVLGAVQGDVHPPTYYLLEWLNTHLFGNSEFVLRMPAVLFGACSVVLIYAIARELKFGQRAAIIAGVLTALLPGDLYYSQEARVYALMSCALLVMVLGALRERWWMMFIGGVATVYCHNLGLLYVFAVGVAVLVTRFRATRKLVSLVKPASALAATAAAWLPWAAVMLKQMTTIGQAFWITPVSIGSIVNPLATMTLGFRASAWLQLITIPAAYALTGVGLIVSRRWLRSRDGVIFLAAVFGAPVLAALVSVAWKSIYLPRAFLGSALLLTLVWSYALSHLSKVNRRVMAAVLIPAYAIGVIANYFPPSSRSAVVELTQVVRDEWHEGDVVYFTSIPPQILAGYYLPGKPQVLAPWANDLNQWLNPDAKRAFGFDQQEFPPSGYKRAWLVFIRNFGTSAGELAFLDRAAPYSDKKLATVDNGIEIWLVDLAEVRAAWRS